MDPVSFLLHFLFVPLIEKPVRWIGRHLRKWAYEHSALSKHWFCQFNIDGKTGNETIVLKQYGTQIEGTIDTTIGDEEYKLKSEFYGHIADEYVFAIYKPASKGDFGSGVILMRILEHGTKLKGCCAFQYSKDRLPRIIDPYIWNIGP